MKLLVRARLLRRHAALSSRTPRASARPRCASRCTSRRRRGTVACRCSTTWPGLTCTEETFAIKAGAQRLAAEHGLHAGRARHQPARARCRATTRAGTSASPPASTSTPPQAPWSAHYRMYSYVTRELPALIAAQFARADTIAAVDHRPLDGRPRRAGLRAAQSGAVPLGLGVRADRRAVAGAVGPQGVRAATSGRTTTGLARVRRDPPGAPRAASATTILVDQGLADKFLAEQLRPDLFAAACAARASRCSCARHAGYDHGYYFIQTFMADHVAWHARALQAD